MNVLVAALSLLSVLPVMAQEPGTAGVKVTFAGTNVSVQVFQNGALSAVLEEFCAKTRSVCEGTGVAEKIHFAAAKISGTWDQVATTLLEGHELNYVAVAPGDTSAGKLLILGRALAIEDSRLKAAAAQQQTTGSGVGSGADEVVSGPIAGSSGTPAVSEVGSETAQSSQPEPATTGTQEGPYALGAVAPSSSSLMNSMGTPPPALASHSGVPTIDFMGIALPAYSTSGTEAGDFMGIPLAPPTASTRGGAVTDFMGIPLTPPAAASTTGGVLTDFMGIPLAAQTSDKGPARSPSPASH